MGWLEWPGWGGISGIVALIAVLVAGIIAIVELRAWALMSDAAAMEIKPLAQRTADGRVDVAVAIRVMGPKTFFELQVFLRQDPSGAGSSDQSDAEQASTPLAQVYVMDARDAPVTASAVVSAAQLSACWIVVTWMEFTRMGPVSGATRIRLDSSDRQWWKPYWWPLWPRTRNGGRWKAGRFRNGRPELAE